MDTTERARLVQIMRDLAAGDPAAVASLYLEFGHRIEPMVRRRLGQLGVRDASQDDVTDLTIDACFELEATSRGWDPAGGALPWNWAARRIDAMVAKWVGVFTDPLDDQIAFALEDPTPLVSPVEDAGALPVLAQSASPAARLLIEAFDAARVSPRDQEVALEFALQRSLGDPSPSTTVGAGFGLRPEHVRQIFRRTRVSLGRVVSADDRFADLRDVPLLAP